MLYYSGIIWAGILILSIAAGSFGIFSKTNALLFTVCSLGAYVCYLANCNTALQCLVYIAGVFVYALVFGFSIIKSRMGFDTKEKGIVVFLPQGSDSAVCFVKYKSDIIFAVCRDDCKLKAGSVVFITSNNGDFVEISKNMPVMRQKFGRHNSTCSYKFH